MLPSTDSDSRRCLYLVSPVCEKQRNHVKINSLPAVSRAGAAVCINGNDRKSACLEAINSSAIITGYAELMR